MTGRSTTGALARGMTLAVALLVLGTACDRDRSSGSAPETTTSTGDATEELRLPVEDGDARPAVAPATDFIEDSVVTPDGRTRTYRLYVPTTLRPGDEVPLLLALHGGGGNGRQFANGSQFAGLAEANGFIVAFPDGVSQPRVASAKTWNAGACCGAAADQNVDDVGFLVALVERLREEYTVDSDRIHAAGHSNGSMMALRLACERGDVFASVGGQAGTLDVDECTASDPVSVVALHGTADENLPIDGGRGEFTAQGNDFPPPREGLERLAVLAGCDGASPLTRETTHPDVVVESWEGCPEGVDVEFLVVEGANHAWMGRAGGALESRIGPAYTDLDASLTIWTFLAAHPRPSGS